MAARKLHIRDFAGFKSRAQRLAEQFEKEFGIMGDGVLPNVADICASAQFYMCQHIMKRVWRAMLFCRRTHIDFGNRLVMSGIFPIRLSSLFDKITSLCRSETARVRYSNLVLFNLS